jgi:hypothetical protein
MIQAIASAVPSLGHRRAEAIPQGASAAVDERRHEVFHHSAVKKERLESVRQSTILDVEWKTQLVF